MVLADKYYPSSKTCSDCGVVKTKLSLSERTYECGNCGLHLDRDLNAAINLKNVAQSCGETLNGHGGASSGSLPVLLVGNETSTVEVTSPKQPV